MRCVPFQVGLIGLVLCSGGVHSLAGQSLPTTDPAVLRAVQIDADGAVSIHANGLAVGALLNAFNPACATELRIDPIHARRPVTLDLTRLPASKAAGAVLESAGLDFVIVGARCAPHPHRMRIIAVEHGTVLPLTVPADPDDATERAAVEFGSVPAGGPPEPEVRPEVTDATTATTGSLNQATAPVRAAGEVTAAEMTTMLAPKPRSASSIIELPFTDRDGTPQYQVRSEGRRTIAALPFPDADGNPIQIPIPPGSRTRPFTLPSSVLTPPGVSPPPATKSTNPADRRGGGSNR